MPRGELAPVYFEPPKDREIQSECLEAGIWLTPAGIEAGLDARKIALQMGMQLQHRAQGAAGMMVTNGERFAVRRGMGWVRVVFEEGRNVPDVKRNYGFLNPIFQPIAQLVLQPVPPAHVAEIHGRYPTSGGSNHRENIQPFNRDGIWFAHHGNLTNTDEIKASTPPENRLAVLARKITRKKLPDSDSWFALKKIARTPGKSLAEKLLKAQKNFEGGWAFILTDGKSIVASRDPYGIRPLMLGYIGPEDKPWGYAIAVETTAFEKIKGYRGYRDIEPGETIQIDEKGETVLERIPKGRRPSAFEWVYMQGLNGVFEEKDVLTARKNMGRNLWKEMRKNMPTEFTEGEQILVIPVPDAGRPAAEGFIEEAQKELGIQQIRLELDALIKNRYVGRLYIESSDRRVETEDKYSVIRKLIEGKKIFVIDDSEVHGITAKAIVSLLREVGGAAWVGLGIVSPEIVWRCAFGVDQSGPLIANDIPDLKERAKHLGADYMIHLSRGGLAKAIGLSEEELCMRCFGGDGPPLPKSIIPLNEAGLTRVV